VYVDAILQKNVVMMSKRIKEIEHLNDNREKEFLCENILGELKQGRAEIKSLQKSLANHREDTAINAIMMSSLLRIILEQFRHD
jgi:hypothetical protein